MATKNNWLKNTFVQELILFLGMFALTMLHEWMKLDTIMDFLKGLAFFILVYGQAQFNRFFIFPLLLARKHLAYTLAFILSAAIAATLLFVLDYYWISPRYYIQLDDAIALSILYYFILCVICTVFMLYLLLVRQYSRERQQRNETQLLLSEMNLKFLHAQLNPHFFFNLFNNLYGVSLTDPARTPGLILKLSQLMRYQLEHGNQPAVSIGEELKFIDNYVAMEQERIGKRCAISYQFPGEDVSFCRHRIAPLILITLVENAFKHSVTISRKWFVRIQIEHRQDNLVIEVCNSMPDEALKNNSTGIGLTNIKARLDMLYKDHYSWDTIINEQEYRTRLTLSLNFIGNG